MYTQIYIHMYTQNYLDKSILQRTLLLIYLIYYIGCPKEKCGFFQISFFSLVVVVVCWCTHFSSSFFFVKKVKGKKLLHCSLDGCVLRSPVGKWDFLFMSFCFFSYSISSSKLDFRMIRLKDIAQVKKHATSKASYNQSSSQYLPCWSVSESYLLSSTTYTYYTKSGRKIKFLKKALKYHQMSYNTVIICSVKISHQEFQHKNIFLSQFLLLLHVVCILFSFFHHDETFLLDVFFWKCNLKNFNECMTFFSQFGRSFGDLWDFGYWKQLEHLAQDQLRIKKRLTTSIPRKMMGGMGEIFHASLLSSSSKKQFIPWKNAEQKNKQVRSRRRFSRSSIQSL